MSYTLSFDASVKVSKGSMGGFLHHIGRDVDKENGMETRHANQDIDPARTADNATLVYDREAGGWVQCQDTGEIQAALNARLGDVMKPLRKDAVVLRPLVLQLDPEWYAAHQDGQERGKAADDMLAWAADTFGTENLVYVSLHNDEANPHLHLGFCPVTDDGRLSQKDWFSSPAALRQMHDDFRAAMASKGYDIDQARRKPGKYARRMNEQEYKKAAEQERQQLEKTAAEASRRAEKAVIEAQALQDSLVGQKALYEALRAINDEMEDLPRSNEMYPPYAKRRKWPLMNQETVTVPVTEWECIVRSMKSYSAMQNAQEKLDKSMKDVQRTPTAQRVEELTRHVEELTEKEEYWMDKYRAAEKELERMRQQGPYAGLTILEQLHPDLWPYIEEAMKVVDMPEYRRYSYISEHTQSRETDQEHENSGPDLGM